MRPNVSFEKRFQSGGWKIQRIVSRGRQRKVLPVKLGSLRPPLSLASLTCTHCLMKWLCCGTVALANTVCLSLTLLFTGAAAPDTLPIPAATSLAASSSSCVCKSQTSLISP